MRLFLFVFLTEKSDESHNGKPKGSQVDGQGKTQN